MIALVTSCGRHDLLKKTIDDFWKDQHFKNISIIVHEDDIYTQSRHDLLIHDLCDKVVKFNFTEKVGQHRSIERFISNYPNEKYGLMLEDDWSFSNDYDWIQASIDIMEADPSIIKVLVREDSPHPVSFDHTLFDVFNKGVGKDEKLVCEVSDLDQDEQNNYPRFGYLEPWENNGINWCGFSWNPGVTRLDLLRKFVPFGKHEQDIAAAICAAGYKVVALEKGVYTHIGEGRSTHE